MTQPRRSFWMRSFIFFGVALLFEAEASAQAAPAPAPIPAGYVLVPAGSFKMGSPATEAARSNDEAPFEVTITRSFLLKETEVTQGEWQALMGNNPSYFSACGPDCPVEKVSWFDALAFCNALSKKEGLTACYKLSGCVDSPGTEMFRCDDKITLNLSCSGYRLPTEAEWEYAYRAGTTAAFYNGDNIQPSGPDPNLDLIGWFDKNAHEKTHPVKGKKPNAWGLYDMSGNVWEWTWDVYGNYPTTPQRDPKPSAPSYPRVFRGGSWNDLAGASRAAERNDAVPDDRDFDLGFRPARTYPVR